MKWLARILCSITEKILFVLLSAMTVIVFAQVLSRYVFHTPLYWTEEAARYLQIWIVFLGASVGIRRGAHLGFTWFVERARTKMKTACAIISAVGLFAFSVNITYYGTIISLQNLGQLSPGLQMPIAYLYACLPVGGILCIIQLIPILKDLFVLTKTAKASQS
ncbi:MAG: TRAP transporter small permease [Candidatus Paceibacterota bacterium]